MSSLVLLIVTVVSGLITAALIWFASQRRLYVVVPKLFAHSSLASKGRTIELTIINRGYRSEEDIRIELDPNLNYEQIASTDPAVKLTDSAVQIERIPANDEVTVLILAERGRFGKKSIAKISSKECKGTVVEKLENVPPSIGALVGSTFSASIVLFFFIGAGWFLHDLIDPDGVFDSVGIAEVEIPEDLAALNWRNMEAFVRTSAYKTSPDKSFPIEITEVKREGEVVTVKVAIKNSFDQRISVSGKLISPAEEDNDVVRFGDHFFHDALVFSGQNVERLLKVYLPQNVSPQMVVANFSIKFPEAGVLGNVNDIEKDFLFEDL